MVIELDVEGMPKVLRKHAIDRVLLIEDGQAVFCAYRDPSRVKAEPRIEGFAFLLDLRTRKVRWVKQGIRILAMTGAPRNEFVAVTSTNAAKIFNIYPRKGSISAGADADIAVLDPEKEKVISKDTHHQNVDFNIFEGMRVKGINVLTVSQGKITYRDGEVRTERGVGRYIDRPCFAPYYDAMRVRRDHHAPRAVERMSAPEG